jgi:hypothetical protein
LLNGEGAVPKAILFRSETAPLCFMQLDLPRKLQTYSIPLGALSITGIPAKLQELKPGQREKAIIGENDVPFRPLETPVFYEGVEMSIYIIKTWHSEFFLLRDELHDIKNAVAKIPIDFSTA